MPSIWKAGTSASRRAGLACLLLALVFLGLFQFRVAGRSISVTLRPFTTASFSLDMSEGRGGDSVQIRAFKGYEVWKEMFKHFPKRHPIPRGEPIFASCLAAGTLLTLVSPFLAGVLGRCLRPWQFVLACSLLVTAGTTGLWIWHLIAGGASPMPWDNPTALAPLLGFPPLHLCGMLFIRPGKNTPS